MTIKNSTIIHNREERLPEVEAFLEKLGVRTRDSDFDSLRKIVDDALAQGDDAFGAPVPPRWQDRVIEELVAPQSSILDVGCGEGDLLVRLAENTKATVQGLELNQEMVMRCIERGIPTYHGDLENGLKNFPDKAFDYVILEETLQTLARPMNVLKELLRVGHKSIISFPNFAHWKVRLAFSLGGRMPMTEALPYQWHDTPNIHLCSINDFMDWTLQDKVHILAARVLVNGKVEEYREEHNLTAQQALFLVEPQ
jgi:methionine biosynthesis protein MetW